MSEQDILDHGAKQIADPNGGVLLVDDPGVDAAFRAAKSTLERTYTTGSVLHVQLEPVNALAFEKDGLFEIHTGNQWQSLILPVLSQALGLPQERIVCAPIYLGGGFGRRLNGDYAVPAALAAKALGKPVKLVLTRPDDMRFDSFRSPSIQTLRMAFGDARQGDGDGASRLGRLADRGHGASGPCPKGLRRKTLRSICDRRRRPLVRRGRAARTRALERPRQPRVSSRLAALGRARLDQLGGGELYGRSGARRRAPIPSRSASACWTARVAMPGSSAQFGGRSEAPGGSAQRVAQKAGWGAPMPKDTGLGVATTFGQERNMPTWIACVARVRVDRGSGAVTVEKLTIVVDAGTVVHPDGALAQVEGGALWGLSMALHEGTEFVKGQVKDTNLDSYTPLRIGDVPELDIEFIDSAEAPVGLGEPGTTVVAPAIGNAIFAAVGARLRNLPIRPAAVRDALTRRS